MSDAIVLDATSLGLLCHPRNPPQVMSCRQWVDGLLAARRRVIVAEIADYEVRRELVRVGSAVAIQNLNQLSLRLEYLPLSTPAMRLAADLWAQARSSGQPTASDHALDADVILAAQSLDLKIPVILATENPYHLSRFVPVEIWQNIKH